MLLNPHTQKDLLETIQGTRLLLETLGLIGHQVFDPAAPLHIWTIQGLYAPIRGRALGGIRAKAIDQKGFVAFCNQRDLEILLDLASPGHYCHWLGDEYPDYGDPKWFGMCADEDDLLDDLYDCELEVRAQYDNVVPHNMSFTRRVHESPKNDFEEGLMCIWDAQANGVDHRFETIERRWASYERTPPNQRARLWRAVV